MDANFESKSNKLADELNKHDAPSAVQTILHEISQNPMQAYCIIRQANFVRDNNSIAVTISPDGSITIRDGGVAMPVPRQMPQQALFTNCKRAFGSH